MRRIIAALLLALGLAAVAFLGPSAAAASPLTSTSTSTSTAVAEPSAVVVVSDVGTNPPPPRFSIFIRNYFGPTTVQLGVCVGQGEAGISDGLWSDYYCWITSSSTMDLWVQP
ncbi:hypothetical protein BJF78_02165 [Pseudonocardia sp. CNS-139]|nr:hypothetical protein BJF78_02165 [Pseudonocardia sp. CNS-139]